MIHLINMPFGSSRHPSLALGQIKAQLDQAGFETRVFNFNLYFARQIGLNAYETMGLSKGVDTQIGEWLFAEQAWRNTFPRPSDDFFHAFKKKIDKTGKLQDVRKWIDVVHESLVPSFLKVCVDTLTSAGDIQILGFSCAFFQTTPSLALGRLVKELCPKVKLVFGGPCFHGEMGKEFMEKIPWIDAVATGEADDAIVPLFTALGENREPSGLPGILYRNESGRVIHGPSAQPVSQQTLEKLPFPDHNDFFNDSVYTGLDKDKSWRDHVQVFFEGSRGCWWGEKCHCTFCGLNGNTMNYRAKSGKRVYEILSHHAENYPVSRLLAADNNMCKDYFDSLLPLLEHSPFRHRVKLYFEVRTTLRREQVKDMVRAGIVYLQPGIENLSTNILKCMKKGVKGIRNVYFLKLCRQYGLLPTWNLLIRIPGERIQDYHEMERLIPDIMHLHPPYLGEPRKVECHRFSAYHKNQERWLENIRPQSWYYNIFPSEVIDVSKIAYYFDAVWKDTLEDHAYDKLTTLVSEWLRRWKDNRNPPELTIEWGISGETKIRDTRSGKLKIHRLKQNKALIYRLLDDPISLTQLHAAGKKAGISAGSVDTALEELTRHGLALQEKELYLGLAYRGSGF